MTDKAKYIVSVAFVLFIGIFAVLFWVVPKENFSPKEKRYLSDMPELTFDTLTDGSFESEFETYIDDHMIMRDVFTGINSYSNVLMMNNDANGVYKCADGYLINKPKTDSRLNLNNVSVCEFKEKTGIDTTVMVIPSTGYIMDDVLPVVHENYNDDEYYSRIKTSCKNGGLRFVDLRNVFKTEKADTQIYYKTDHHWTTDGAYIAYLELCKSWGITPAGTDSFEIEEHKDFLGTTYNTSALWLSGSDTIRIYNNRDNKSTCSITENGKTTKYSSMYFKDNLKGADKYEVFLNGNHPVTTIKNKENKGKGKLLVVKDSFSHSLAPFLSENFEEVTLVDMRYFKGSVSDEICKGNNFDKALICYGMDNYLEDNNLAFISD